MVVPPPATLTHARYAPGEVLGAGGQGVVLRVTDREAPERPLVAKVWRSLSSDDGLAAEFALLSRVDAPGLVRAHDLGRDEATGLPFLVEDYVDGLDAVAWIAAAPASERVHRFGALLADVTTTLTALHDAGFLHGDLKPAHVRVSREGRARLLDLGAAVVRGLLQPLPAMISPGFAAPEVVAGAPPTERSELYGLGALAWAAATGQTPSREQRGLRAYAPWVPPSLADVVDALLAVHPRDRPEDARAVLALLGRETSLRGAGSGARVGLVGREVELRSLAADGAVVRYLVGPSGVGKSHVARELVTRTLLAGRPARLLAFPEVPGRLASRLAAYLRGADEAWPFGDAGDGGPALIVLDDLERAPPELAVALDTFRCLHVGPARARFLATAREAPAGAEAMLLGPLDDASLGTLARALGEHDPVRASEVVRAASGSPGWVAAAVRGTPLTEAALRAGVAGLSPAARSVVGLLGLVGGTARPSWVASVVSGWAGGVAQAAARGLVVRRAGDGDGGPTLALAAPALSPVLAALADAPLVDALASVVLGDPDAPVVALRTLATAAMATSRRDELLTLAASRARRQARRGDELDALLALAAASPAARTAELLGRLERLTRDSGQASSYPQVLSWLDEAGDGDARLRPLALRRRAEKSAREGEHARADELAEQARAASHAAGDAAGEAFALATLGLARLFRSEWASAHDALRAAREELASVVSVDDVEEVARLDHNLGVVAVYRGRIPEAVAAFERSLGVKQRLGDRAGMRACLRNLGYALVRAGRLDEAATALDHALALAVSLGQAAGRAWCLAARAEVELARGAPARAERLVAEALALGDAVPAAVRADLGLLSADVALAWGDGAGALEHVASLSAATRAEDPFVEARALIASSRAQLAALPARPREAARLAIRAIRVARVAGLPEPEAGGLAALRAARGVRVAGASAGAQHAGGMAREASDVSDATSGLWAWLQDLGAGAPAEAAAVALAGLVAREAGAERAFVALVRAGAAPEVWAADLDGLAIAEAAKRLPEGAIEAALASERTAYQRDVPTAGGHGSRLAVAAPAGVEPVRAVVVAEHRFVVARFDSVSDAAARRWATAAALLARVGAPPAVAATPAPEPPAARAAAPASSIDPTTFVPLEGPRRTFPTLIGKSAALRRALARLDAAIDTELPVLLVGETGVGKELFARAVHDHGVRARAPFVAVNCAAIPDSLFEAELFGHARGSFTGADRARPGLFASADAGTLFLDEIGELSLGRQASLLRVLETQRYRPVGSDEEKPARARIVAATNRDLELAVAEGRFRQDLLFRLDVLRVRIPPLRLREGDVEVLARHFLKQAGSSSELSPQVLGALAAHAWPGNVRELSHQMQRLAALRLPHIELAHLPRELRVIAPIPSPEGPTPDEERAVVERALAVSGGNISRAAKTLGLSRHGLKKRMLRLGLREAAAKVTDS